MDLPMATIVSDKEYLPTIRDVTMKKNKPARDQNHS